MGKRERVLRTGVVARYRADALRLRDAYGPHQSRGAGPATEIAPRHRSGERVRSAATSRTPFSTPLVAGT
jgi:hypothetical protein